MAIAGQRKTCQREKDLTLARKLSKARAMPTTTGLTEKQSAFVASYLANGGQLVLAARDAGYSHPETETPRLMATPHVLAAIRAGFERAIQTEGAAKAWGLISKAITDESWPKHLRLDAAKFILKAGGYEQKEIAPSMDKPLSEMTVAELEEFTQRGHAALDALKSAQVIELEPISEPTPAKADGF